MFYIEPFLNHTLDCWCCCHFLILSGPVITSKPALQFYHYINLVKIGNPQKMKIINSQVQNTYLKLIKTQQERPNSSEVHRKILT